MKNLSDFMYQTFIKAKVLDPKDMDFIVTYENSLRLKAPKRVLDIKREYYNFSGDSCKCGT